MNFYTVIILNWKKKKREKTWYGLIALSATED